MSSLKLLDVGPTGNIVRGTVLDCNKEALELALKRYDAQLYLKWNPKKNRGFGLWEVRRRPEQMMLVPKTIWKGDLYSSLEYVENNLVHHVMDSHSLNYHIVERVKAMDTWKTNEETGLSFTDRYEAKERAHAEEISAKQKEAIKYKSRYYKKEIRDLKEALQSGLDPNRLANYWK